MVSHCACPTRVFGNRALHEHRRASSLPPHAPSKLACLSLLEWHPCWSNCGRRTSTFRSCAFREQGTSVGVSPFLTLALIFSRE